MYAELWTPKKASDLIRTIEMIVLPYIIALPAIISLKMSAPSRNTEKCFLEILK